jgi:hypothetical protein
MERNDRRRNASNAQSAKVAKACGTRWNNERSPARNSISEIRPKPRLRHQAQNMRGYLVAAS